MTHRPSKANRQHGDERTSQVRAASLALRAVGGTSLRGAVIDILAILHEALPVHCVSFWQLAADGKQLHRIGTGDDRAVRVEGAVAKLVAENAGLHRVAAESGLSGALELSPHAASLLVQPVRVLGEAFGILCFECHHDDVPDTEAALLVDFAAARIETLQLAESLRARRQEGALRHYAMQQSHLVLDDNSLRDLFYLAPTAMLLTDPADARPVAFNQHALALLRISTEHNDDLYMTAFWDDAHERNRFIQEALSRGHVRDRRVRLRRTNGERFWAQVSATAIDYDGRRVLMSSITDVSDTVAAEEILNRTQKTLMTLLEASPYPLIVTRLDSGVIRFCNQKAADMFETPLSGLLGHTAPEFYVNPSDRSYFVDKLRDAGKVDGFVAKLKTGGGQPFWAMLSAKTLELNGEPVFMVAFADVTKQKHKEAELETLAFKDGLTNAYNRRYFVEAARMELARAERNARPPALALIDIDHFKALNDSHGHEAGDQVLREFVRVVQGLLRKTDILARYGGEEFVVLFPEMDADEAFDVVERIRAEIAGHEFEVVADGIALAITVSAGVTAGARDYPLLMREADEALYMAKRNGRNQTARA